MAGGVRVSRRRATYGCGVRGGAACGWCGVVWVQRVVGAAVCGWRGVVVHVLQGARAAASRGGRRAAGVARAGVARRAGARARGNPVHLCATKGRAMSLTELEIERTYANVPPLIKCVSWEPRRQSYDSGFLRMSSIGSSTCTSKSACAQGEVRENEDDTGRGGAAARQWGTGEDSSSGGAAGMRRCSPSEYG